MRITVAGGATHDVDLKLLSLEQRQILWRAIARRANLVEIREQPWARAQGAARRSELASVGVVRERGASAP